MAKLEIDREDIHDRKKWRRNVIKRKMHDYIFNGLFYMLLILVCFLCVLCFFNKDNRP